MWISENLQKLSKLFHQFPHQPMKKVSFSTQNEGSSQICVKTCSTNSTPTRNKPKIDQNLQNPENL